MLIYNIIRSSVCEDDDDTTKQGGMSTALLTGSRADFPVGSMDEDILSQRMGSQDQSQRLERHPSSLQLLESRPSHFTPSYGVNQSSRAYLQWQGQLQVHEPNQDYSQGLPDEIHAASPSASLPSFSNTSTPLSSPLKLSFQNRRYSSASYQHSARPHTPSLQKEESEDLVKASITTTATKAKIRSLLKTIESLSQLYSGAHREAATNAHFDNSMKTLTCTTSITGSSAATSVMVSSDVSATASVAPRAGNAISTAPGNVLNTTNKACISISGVKNNCTDNGSVSGMSERTFGADDSDDSSSLSSEESLRTRARKVLKRDTEARSVSSLSLPQFIPLRLQSLHRSSNKPCTTLMILICAKIFAKIFVVIFEPISKFQKDS